MCWGGPRDTESRDCTCVPSHHIPTHSKTPASSSCTHTITHTACALLREKHLLLHQCAEITVRRKERVVKQGMQRKNTSFVVAAQHVLFHGAVVAQELYSYTHTHTHSQERTPPDILKWPCVRRKKRWKDSIRVVGFWFVTETLVWRKQTQEKAM